MDKDYKYYKQLISDAGITIISIYRDLKDFNISHKTVERFFSGVGINKTNEQIIINHVNKLTNDNSRNG